MTLLHKLNRTTFFETQCIIMTVHSCST